MFFPRNKLVLVISSLIFVGCTDRYEEGFQKGFADGFEQATAIQNTICSEKIDEQKRFCGATSEFSSGSGGYSTEVCGGGANVNGEHHKGGKTGCVRVFSDGRVERY